MLFIGSGDIVLSLREFTITRKNKTYVLFFLLPDFYAKNKYRLDKELDYTLDSQGVLIREYPKELVQSVSDSSENPVSVVYCHFDGIPVINDMISQLKFELQMKQNVIDRQKSEMKRYEEEIQELTDAYRLTKRKQLEVED